jgi:hypothetical protein
MPTVDDTPRDSVTAQTMSWPATLVAVVVGRMVCRRLVLALEVNGAKEPAQEDSREDMMVFGMDEDGRIPRIPLPLLVI